MRLISPIPLEISAAIDFMYEFDPVRRDLAIMCSTLVLS